MNGRRAKIIRKRTRTMNRFSLPLEFQNLHLSRRWEINVGEHARVYKYAKKIWKERHKWGYGILKALGWKGKRRGRKNRNLH